ncbi:MAG: sulfotransferase [Rudaea sp.]|uniref:sulfotransferase family protein n=1 Tax=Rudaea sp. TaxID=2136325 RepID=UPI0039E38A71
MSAAVRQRSWLGTMLATAATPAAATPGHVFIVGCPRSGTTFLQAALAAHPQILSMPETALFEHVVPGKPDLCIADGRLCMRMLRRRGVPGLHRHRGIRRVFADLAQTLDMREKRPRLRYRLSGYVRDFVALLDEVSLARGRSVWIEKTPSHVFHIDTIAEHVPNPKFVHILRNGEEVVASLIDACLRYQHEMKGLAFDKSIPYWIAYWNAAMEIHERHAGHPDHCIVFYEDLIDDFAGEYARICEFVGVSIPERPGRITEPLARIAREPWKRQALSGELVVPARKFERMFGPECQRWIREELKPYAEVRAAFARAGRGTSSG